MARLVLAALSAVVASAGNCLGDLETVIKDSGAAAVAVKGLVSDCKGDDRTQCQADVSSLLDALDQMQKDIAPATTDCEGKSPGCTAALNKLGDDIGKLKEPAQAMADKCAGKDESKMECVFDGIKVGAASVAVLADVHTTYSTCKQSTVVV